MSLRTDRTAIRDPPPSLSKRHERVPLLSPSMSSAARVSLSLFRLGYRRRLTCDSYYAVRHVFVEADTRPHSSDILPQRYHKSMCLRSFSSDGKTVPHAKDEVEETARLAAADDPDDRNNSKIELIYEGTLASHVRSLKRISISTCIISILAVPALAIWGTDNVPMAGQVAVMGTAMAGTGCSTLLLNICVSPYVIRMAEVITDANGEGDDPSSIPENKLNRPSMPRLMGRRFLAERMNIFGLSTTSEFYVDEVEPTPKSSRPFASFRVDGKYYYIQGHEMADKALLRTLLGRELKEHEK